jgi:P pilus assembly chaperone PapD
MEKINVAARRKNIEVNNPTPYFITIDRAMIDGHTKIDVDMISPFQQKPFSCKVPQTLILSPGTLSAIMVT